MDHRLCDPVVPDWIVADRAKKYVLGDPSWCETLQLVGAGAWLRAIGKFCRKYALISVWIGTEKQRIIYAAVTEFERVNRWQLDAMRAPPKTPAEERAEHELMYFDAVA